jgi:hypothetical protein
MRPAEYFRRGLTNDHYRRLHKPFYVDWDDFLSHQLFRRFTKLPAATTLTVTEMLPTPEQIVSPVDGRTHSAEYLAELYGPANEY